MEPINFEQSRIEAEKEGKAHTKGWWKDQCRLKPIDPLVCSGSYKNSYGDECFVYDFAQCKPMRPLSTKPRSPKQMAAAKKLATKAKAEAYERSPRAIAVREAKELIESDTVIIHVESTGLGSSKQIVFITLIESKTGNKLFSSYVKPGTKIEAEAHQIHGIIDEDLTGAPEPQAVWDQVKEIIGERKITGFNREFITDSILESLSPTKRKNNSEYKVFRDEIDAIFNNCIMDLAKEAWGDWDSLLNLLEFIGEKPETPRTSGTQAEAARKVLHHIANTPTPEF